MVDSTSPISTTGTGSTAATKSLTQTYDQFIKLLTAQMKYQNPLDPMKPEQFTQQLVEFASVEQSISTNKNLEKLLAIQTGTQMTMAIGYVGANITTSGDTNYLTSGNATYGYTMPLAAQTATISILNSSGQTVYSTSANTSPGTYAFDWDGKDANGVAQPDGQYKIVVSAKDAEGKAINGITTTFTGTVTGVESKSGVVYLNIGPLTVAIDKVSKVA